MGWRNLYTVGKLGDLIRIGRTPVFRTAWRNARQTGAHFVCIAGEAGIGKSRLAEELLVDVQRQGHASARTRTYALEGRLPYGPVAEWLRSEPLRRNLSKLNKVWLSEVARLLPELLVEQPDLPSPPPLTARWQQKQLFEALVQVFTLDQRPLLLILDDLQWCDPETLEWLHYLLEAAPQAPILVVGTMRNNEMDEDHPLYQLGRSLLREEKLTILELSPLNVEATMALGAQVAHQGLDNATSQRLYRETAGNPLFVMECVRASLPTEDNGLWRQKAQAEAFVVAELPPKVQSVIQTRLAQLSPEAHGVAHLAATVGRPCAVELLVQASQQDEETVVRAIEELWRRRLLREQEPGFYDFSHDRLRDVAYAELSPMRRRLYHRRIAQALEQIYAATLDRMSGQVATQYELAGMPEQAVPYYQQAASTARQLYANREVIHYLQKGLALLRDLPSTSVHRQQALKMQVDLAAALFDIEGWASPAAEQAYARAFELCQQAEKTEHLFPILWGLHEVYLFQAKYDQARALAEQCMVIAERVQDSALLLEAHHAMWSVLGLLSPREIELARMHAEQGIALYDPQQHHRLTHLYGGHDPGVCSLNFAAGTLWQLGYPDQSQRRGEEVIRLGYQLNHPFSLALALVNVAGLHAHRRESDIVLALMTKAMPIATQWEMPPLLAQGRITLGWAQVMQGNVEQGLAELHQGLAEWRNMGIVLRQVFYLLLLSEAYAKAGQIESALRTLDEAQAAAYATGERFEESEIHRLRGELSLVAGKAVDEAEAAFHQAIQIARQQKMKLLEIRAVVSLSRLWQQQGKITEARELLAAIYHWFTEGFDTLDLQEAKALLDELNSICRD